MESHPRSPSLLFTRRTASSRVSATTSALSSSPIFLVGPVQAPVTGIHVRVAMSPSCGAYATGQDCAAEKSTVAGQSPGECTTARASASPYCKGHRAVVVRYAMDVRQVARRRAGSVPAAALCCVSRACRWTVDSGSRRAGVAVKATTAALPAAAHSLSRASEAQTLSTACTLASNFGPAEEPCRRTRWTTSWAGVCICLSILLPCVRSRVSDQRCCYLVGHGMLSSWV